MKIKGLKLWLVGVNGLDTKLWITGPFKTVASKAVAVAKKEHGFLRPTIHSIKSRGTIDA